VHTLSGHGTESKALVGGGGGGGSGGGFGGRKRCAPVEVLAVPLTLDELVPIPPDLLGTGSSGFSGMHSGGGSGSGGDGGSGSEKRGKQGLSVPPNTVLVRAKSCRGDGGGGGGGGGGELFVLGGCAWKGLLDAAAAVEAAEAAAAAAEIAEVESGGGGGGWVPVGPHTWCSPRHSMPFNS